MSEMNQHKTRRDFIRGTGMAAGTIAVGTAIGGSTAYAHEVEINAMGPTPEQMQQFMSLPDGPIVMVNLLKFKPDGGAEEYGKIWPDDSAHSQTHRRSYPLFGRSQSLHDRRWRLGHDRSGRISGQDGAHTDVSIRRVPGDSSPSRCGSRRTDQLRRGAVRYALTTSRLPDRSI